MNRDSGFSSIDMMDDDDMSLDMDFDDADSTGGMSRLMPNAENQDLKKETRKTSVIRCLMITTLLTVAATTANIALIMVLARQEHLVKDTYQRLSNRVMDRFVVGLQEQISSADSFVSELTLDPEQAPQLTVPNFQQSAEAIRRLSSATTISFSPWIEGTAALEAWKDYASNTSVAETTKYFETEYFPHHGKYMTEPLVTYRNHETEVTDLGMVETDQQYMPIWQIAPFTEETKSAVLFNQRVEAKRERAIESMIQHKGFVISDIFQSTSANSLHEELSAPVFAIYYPVFGKEDRGEGPVLAALVLEIGLESFFEDVLKGFDHEPLTVVVESSCGETASFTVKGSDVLYLGAGDIREETPDVGEMNFVGSTYEDFEAQLLSYAYVYPVSSDVICKYRVTTYPTLAFYEFNVNNKPFIVQVVVGAVCLCTVLILLAYDCLIERRQRKILRAGQRTNDLMGSLFPKGVRDRLIHQGDTGNTMSAKGLGEVETAPKLRLKSYMANDASALERSNSRQPGNATKTEPIADLFPNATVLFADISGFTAWSSEREPSQVFVLLETLYGGIDSIARKLGVFKVETVGDCYVAATGIPEARDDHAVVMCRFAHAMLARVKKLTKILESTLGPGTADLNLRVGVHSGPVTAGVLRGEKSRFQLFGDTMNTASRMESTSERGMIQLSNETVALLQDANKSQWVEPREDLVDAKGKGSMQTFWLKRPASESHSGDPFASRRTTTSEYSGTSVDSEDDANEKLEVKERLIDWNVQVMMSLIERIVARREKKAKRVAKSWMADATIIAGERVLDEVKEVIELPKFNAEAFMKADDQVLVPGVVRSQLRDFISKIANTYNDNPFHNFQHASHVCLSAQKLLKRITRPDDVNYGNDSKATVALQLHEHTYGISSDPVTQLAMLFAALVHDAGHTGVPNGQLAKEYPLIAEKYGNQSVAEQRSVAIAWTLLESKCYDALREFIFPKSAGLSRFRKLIVNSVIATDIFDKELSAARKLRWNKAFGPKQPEWTDSNMIDRKATIVIEHVIQASDVAHTMQHWHVYQKWNKLLFQEMYLAFAQGRAEKDPSVGWYKGELWFFDNYVIPLAKKLKECGVFGASSDEYLNYATENREEWEVKGEKVVAEMLKECKDSFCPEDVHPPVTNVMMMMEDDD